MKKHLKISATLNVCIFLFLIKESFCLDPFYNLCLPKQCGDGINIRFPFFIKKLQDPICGRPSLELECNSNGSAVIQISGYEYSVKGVDYERKSVRLVINTRSPNITCPSPVTNFTTNWRFKINNSLTTNLVFLKNCSRSQLPVNLTRYRIPSCDQLVMLGDDANLVFGKEVCTNVVVAPVELEDENTVVDGGNYIKVMDRGFTSTWTAVRCDNCEISGGRCGFNVTTMQFVCFCSDRPHSRSCIISE
ncbi:protein kinase, catalytic domain-containing protein [Tanacetum coccineum]